MSKPNKYIPLSEVNEHSDVIAIGELGLPVGMDTSRLVMNVGGLERIARLGQIGNLDIRGYRGDTTEYSYGIGGSSEGGAASATHSVTATKAELSEASSQEDAEPPIGFRWAKSTVKINTAEIESRIKADGDRWDMDVYDPAARAKYMDLALKQGLRKATTEATYPHGVMPLVVTNVIMFGGLYAVLKYGTELTDGAAAIVTGGFAAANSTIDNTFASKVAHRGEYLPKPQLSFLAATNADRLLVSKTLIATTRLIKALPQTKTATTH